MKMHYIIRRIAGTFVVGSVALGYFHSPWWFLFTAFVGLNLFQSSFTMWCLMEDILEGAGLAKREPRASTLSDDLARHGADA